MASVFLLLGLHLYKYIFHWPFPYLTFQLPQVTCRGWGYFFPFLNTVWLLSGFFCFTLNRLGLAVAMDEILRWVHP